MRPRTKVFLATTAFLAFAFGVASVTGLPVQESSLPGTYVCAHSFGTEELLLRCDHTYRQSLALTSGGTTVNEGRWHFEKTLVLEAAIVADSGMDTFRYSAMGEKVNWGINPYMRPWGQIRIETNPDLPLDFVKR